MFSEKINSLICALTNLRLHSLIMQQNITKWGIIGCGDVAEVKSGPAFQKTNGSELVAVMRRDGAKARDFAERHGVAHWYDDAAALLHNPEVNAVYIATPPSSHVEYALQAIEAGKDIYLEKPLARSVADGRQIADALQDKANKLTVAHYRRQMPVFRKVKDLLDSGSIGEVRFVDIRILQAAKSDIIADTEINWRVDPDVSGGGYFFDLAPHQFDLLLSWFGQPVRMTGFSANQQEVYVANDIVQGIIEFPGKIQFRGVWAFNVAESDQMDRCTIYGSQGSIAFSFYGDRVILTTPSSRIEFPFPALPHVQQPLIEATVRYFQGQGQNPCSLAEALAGLEVIEAFSR